MKSLLRALTGLATILAASAQAADPVLAPPVSWTGFYLGANAGILREDTGRAVQRPDTSIAPNGSFQYLRAYGTDATNREKSALIGGGQVGYNYQVGAVMLGAETDLQAASSFGNERARATSGPIFVNPGVQPSYGARGNGGRVGYDYLGTVRGRVGYLAMPDLLLYATGGFAYGERTETDARGQSQMKTGYVAGGGIEYALDQNWSVKGEALYYEFEKSRQNTTTTVAVPVFGGGFTGAATVLQQAGRTIDIPARHGVIARVGLNYRYSGL